MNKLESICGFAWFGLTWISLSEIFIENFDSRSYIGSNVEICIVWWKSDPDIDGLSEILMYMTYDVSYIRRKNCKPWQIIRGIEKDRTFP